MLTIRSGAGKDLPSTYLGITKGVQVVIFSTNYDSAVESICDQQNISYVDGFIRKEKEEYPRFDPSSFDAAKNSIRLYKLHGSINWWSNDSRQIIFKLSLELSGFLG